MGDAVARYRAASEANDADGVMSALTPDVELVSPISGRMVFRGQEVLRCVLTAVLGALTGLRWPEEIGDSGARVVMGDAAVGRIKLAPHLARHPRPVLRALR